uniref:Uncharacterized protein n=1 Tax=Arundo donax TaxID=35708 RepID=A0A0A9D4F6_ARUDO
MLLSTLSPSRRCVNFTSSFGTLKLTLSGNASICFFNNGRMDLLFNVCLIGEVSTMASPVFAKPLLFSGFVCFL